jgi:hypothetical protein
VPILHYLRTKTVNCRQIDLKTLKHEAEFYGVLPLAKRLAVCEEAETGNCGNILFYSMLHPPVFEQSTTLSDSLPLPKLGSKVDFSKQVIQLTGHGNYLAVAYNHCICVLGYDTVWECVLWMQCLIYKRTPRFIPLLCSDSRSPQQFSAIHILMSVAILVERRLWTMMCLTN